MKDSNKVVIIFGPPGAGKGTQSWLLSKRLGFVNFDTGRVIERLVYGPGFRNSKVLERERKIFDSGKLNTPSWVLGLLKKNALRIRKAGMDLLLSGSPRTPFEAFGGNHTEGLIPFLERIYGKNRMTIFELRIPERESLRRNSLRSICEICDTSFLQFVSRIKKCPVCGGKMVKRAVDKPTLMRTRINEYRTRTEPIFKELRKRGFKIEVLDGMPTPFKIFGKVERLVQK